MKFIKLGSTYFFKNSWWMMLIWLLPSIFAGLLIGPFQIVQFMNVYPSTPIGGFSDIFKILMPFEWLKIIFVILGILLVAIFLCMAFGETESHMRSGKLRFKEIFSYVNNDILVTLVNVLLIVVIYAVLTFLLGSILFLLHLLLSGLSNVPTVLNIIIAIVFCVAILIVFTFAVLLFLINIPNMISNGYSFKEGISSTMQLISKNTFKLLLAYLVPYLIIIPLVSGLCRTNALWVANILCFLVTMSYYSSLTMTVYYELSNTSRYDNRKYYNYK